MEKRALVLTIAALCFVLFCNAEVSGFCAGCPTPYWPGKRQEVIKSRYSGGFCETCSKVCSARREEKGNSVPSKEKEPFKARPTRHTKYDSRSATESNEQLDGFQFVRK